MFMFSARLIFFFVSHCFFFFFFLTKMLMCITNLAQCLARVQRHHSENGNLWELVMFLVSAENTSDTCVYVCGWVWVCASLSLTAQEEVLLFKGWRVTDSL